MNDSTEEALERYGTHGDMGATVVQPEMAVTVQEKREMDLPSLFKLAEALVPTGFLPEAIRTPGQAVAIILAGRELGIGPMLALRSIGIIKGKVVLAADLQLAQFKKFGGKADFKELSETKAILWLRHPNGDEHTETFTIEDAKRAGLVRAGGNWTTFPKAMLRSRAITAGLKSLGFEPTCGAYDPDEAMHFQDEASESKLPARATQGKMMSLKPQNATTGNVERSKANPETPKEATEVTKAWFLKMLAPVKAGALAYAVDQGWILPTEGLEDIPLKFVPTSQPKFQAIMDAISQLMGGDQIPGVEVQDDPGMDGDGEEFELSKPDEAWRSLIVPFGKNKGETFGSLEKGQLWWWCVKWQPEDYTGKDGKTYPPKKSDLELRSILDEVRKQYQFTDTKKG